MVAEPACGFDAVNVTVTKIRFHMSATAAASDPGWTEIAVQPARRINLAKMGNGALESLATAALTPGHYGQARLVLDANSGNSTVNSVVVAGTNDEKPLITQAVAADGILLDQGFDIANGQALNLVADFNACQSVVPNGAQFLLRPVVGAVPTVKNGIKGFVAADLLGAHPRVTAQQNGQIIRSTLPDPATGEFFLSRLVPGNYDIVVTADGRAASAIASVPVASAVSTLVLNSTSAPISLQASANGRIDSILMLSPASTAQPAFGSAIKTFASGPSVVIGFRVADLGTGLVHLDQLPATQPLLAIFSATQPLAFSAATVVTPEIGVYTIAASAPGYTSRLPLPFPIVMNN